MSWTDTVIHYKIISRIALKQSKAGPRNSGTPVLVIYKVRVVLVPHNTPGGSELKYRQDNKQSHTTQSREENNVWLLTFQVYLGGCDNCSIFKGIYSDNPIILYTNIFKTTFIDWDLQNTILFRI